MYLFAPKIIILDLEMNFGFDIIVLLTIGKIVGSFRSSF